MTGLSGEQLTELVTRVYAAHGGGFVSRGRPYTLGLFGSVALVVCVMRKNLTQAFAGAIFGVSQATVSRRWDLLRPLMAQVLAEFVPHPREFLGTGTVLVDGTICPSWDWWGIPESVLGHGRICRDERPDRCHTERAPGRCGPDPGPRRPPRRPRLRRLGPDRGSKQIVARGARVRTDLA
jgi:Helix-turn-helix of DDE superfamily endonuclease